MIESDIAKALLRKMFRLRYIGARHTNFDNISKGFPGHLKGRIKKVIHLLIKENLILAKSTSYGLELSLNPKRLDSIREVIR